MTLFVNCAHRPPEAAPRRPTWEHLQLEVRCSEWFSAASSDMGFFPERCQRVVFDALADAYEGAVCSSDQDCAGLGSWLPYGPCCVPVGKAWLRRNAYSKHKDLFDFACGYDSAGSCLKPCEAVCVERRCKIKGQDFLLPLSASEQQCVEQGGAGVEHRPAASNL